MRRSKWAAGNLVVLLAAALLSTGIALAEKGGNGGGKGGGRQTPPGGTVYFIHENAVWTMNTDGSNPAPLMPRGDTFGDPSHLRHAGERWFVNRVVPDGAPQFPTGRTFIEVWADSEAGTSVPLVTEADLEVLSPAVWTADDLSVSFIGERWLLDATGQPLMALETGLYTVDVAYDADGSVAGSVPGSLTFLADLSNQLRTDTEGFGLGNGGNEVAGHSWSPDQTAFTFGVRLSDSSVSLQEIWVVDLLEVNDPSAVPEAALFLLDSGKGIGWPEWSPDGRRVGYVSWGGTYIYDWTRDRTDLLRRTPSTSWGLTEWSPDGSHFVLYHWDNFSGYDAIYRVRADLTGGKTELTAGLCPPDAPSFSCVLIPLGWRE